MIVAVAGLLFAGAYGVVENHRLKEELKKQSKSQAEDFASYNEDLNSRIREIDNDLRSIYLLLAQQGSHMRVIMNTSLTKSHWATHTKNVPQHECPECLRIYNEVHKQIREQFSKGDEENANK